MNKLLLIALVVALTAFAAACGDTTANNKPPEKVPFSGAPDQTSIEMSNTTEARQAIGSIQNQLKALLLSKYEGDVDKMGKALGGPMTAAKAGLLGVQLDTQTYKMSDYSMAYLGGGRFKVTVAPGTRREVVQEISAK